MIYLFIDTNILIQCRWLEEFSVSDWKALTADPDICLVVCRTVQREVDRHKNYGQGRLGKRARKANTLFRKVLDQQTDNFSLLSGAVDVSLVLDPTSRPSRDLVNRLDYSKADDEIIGYAYVYTERYPESQVSVLTYDTGVMLTARELGIAFLPVPDEWLREPEETPSERKVRLLEEKVRSLQQAEPRFSIECVDSKGSTIDSIKLDYEVHKPLTDPELSALVSLLKNRFPKCTDFDKSRSQKGYTIGSAVMRSVGYKKVFVPPRNDVINEYLVTEYPQWVHECTDIMSNLHTELAKNQTFSFKFIAQNKGTRPGKDILIEIIARGNIKVSRPRYRPQEESEEADKQLFPSPPDPPTGHWEHQFRSLDQRVKFPEIPDMSRLLGNLDTLANPLPVGPISSQERRDPNAFYYKDPVPDQPTERFTLECEQWRHKSDSECFEFELYADPNSPINGAVEFVIHAENLSSPEHLLVPVRGQVVVTDLQPYVQDQLEPSWIWPTTVNPKDVPVRDHR